MKKLIFRNASYLLIFCSCILVFSCSKNENIQQTKKEPEKLNDMLIVKGQFIFGRKCMECHELEVKLKGPALRNITKRRKSDWIKNMIMKPDKMIADDSIARKLYYEHGIKMVVKEITEEETEAVMEYLKSVDAKVDSKVN
jgi:cytochrome c551/c552